MSLGENLLGFLSAEQALRYLTTRTLETAGRKIALNLPVQTHLRFVLKVSFTIKINNYEVRLSNS